VFFLHRPRAHEFLAQAIASARSDAELTRLHDLARVHYSGAMLAELEAEVDVRRSAIAELASPRIAARGDRRVD
jgi:hypothetical protein